jgi:hypothetical protein
MDEPTSAKSEGRKNGGVGWIIAVAFVLFVLWMIYTSTQTQVVESGSNAMSNLDRNGTEVSPTEMPENMPGMNH